MDKRKAPRNFPGRHAGASLKRSCGVLVEDHTADFPGRHAGASLKPRRPCLAGGAALAISPADTPGPH